MSINVLLVEDDIDLASTMVDYFEIESISCDHAANGIHGLSLIENNHYDVILLDINLPRLDGLSVCHKVRSMSNDTPILMLTAKDSLSDKIAGFDAGTDDYLVKPFEMEELVVRIGALSKRRSGQMSTLTVGQLTLNLPQRIACHNDENLKLTPITFKLLKKLMQSYETPVARTKLMHAIWGDEQPDSNSLKVHIHHLRKQFEQNNVKLSIITEPGYGFMLTALNPLPS